MPKHVKFPRKGEPLSAALSQASKPAQKAHNTAGRWAEIADAVAMQPGSLENLACGPSITEGDVSPGEGSKHEPHIAGVQRMGKGMGIRICASKRLVRVRRMSQVSTAS